MDVELIGQFHSFGRDFSESRISVCMCGESSFLVYVSHAGDNSVLTYRIQNLDEPQVSEKEPKRRKNSNSSHGSRTPNYRITFLESHVLPFPVYFLASIKHSTWAVSHNGCMELKLDSTCDLDEKYSSDQLMDVDDTKSCDSTETGKFKHNLVCCISKFSGGILMCRENVLHECWVIEVTTTDKKLITLFRIPFTATPLPSTVSCSETKFLCSSKSDKHVPTVTCVEAEAEFNQKNDNVLKRDKFAALFGCSLLSNTVVLIGLPDGKVLWQFMNLPDGVGTITGETRLHLLCNIEQPVRHITLQPLEKTEEVCSIIVVGAYGKVVILSPELRNSNLHNTEVASQASFAVRVSYIPSPVHQVAVCHRGLLHTSSDGQLWVSTFPREKMASCTTSQETNAFLNFQQLNYYGMKHLVVLNPKKGIMMSIGNDGSIYVGNFFSKKSVDRSITEEEMSVLLKSIYSYGNQLQGLEVLAQKQRRLFSAVAIAAKIYFKEDHKVSISCKITEIMCDVKKFFIAVEFQNLKDLNLDPDLWILTASASSVQDKRVTVSQGISLKQDSSCITIEIDPSLFSDYVFPLLVEGGLILDIPTDWKSLSCFENVVTNLPLYVKVHTVLVNELWLLKENGNVTSMDKPEHWEYKNIFAALQKIAETKSFRNHFQSELAVRNYCFPQEFSLPILASSFLSLMKNNVCPATEGTDQPKKLLQHLSRSNISGLPSTSNFTCLGNPVSISVKEKGDLFYITVNSSSFPILVGLKTSLIQLLQDVNTVESTEKNISISSKLVGVLQALSNEISKLQCQNRKEIAQEDIDVYKKLREEISSNLHIL